MSFGGGYYGIVALITYAVVEFAEVRSFLANFEGIAHFIETIGIEMLIDFFINSIMNFVAAIGWPAYWIAEVDRANIWIWFLASYLGYSLGNHFAYDLMKKQLEIDESDYE